MDEKELKRWRKQLGLTAFGNYASQRHPRAPKRPKYLSPSNPNRSMRPIKAPKGMFARRHFTQSEIEAMWLALCKVFDYFGGSRKLFSELTNISSSRIARFIEIGRFTPEAAHEIGRVRDIPFSREELRPDISEEGWKAFDKYYTKVAAHRNRQKYKTAKRISIDPPG